MKALKGQHAPPTAQEGLPPRNSEFQWRTFVMIIAVLTFAALAAACLKWTPSIIRQKAQDALHELMRKYNAIRNQPPTNPDEIELRDTSANSRIGPTDRPHRAAATTSPANNPPTQSQPAGHAEPSESPAPSATPTVAESDDTERTLAAALPLPHALSPVQRPNPPPRNGIES